LFEVTLDSEVAARSVYFLLFTLVTVGNNDEGAVDAVCCSYVGQLMLLLSHNVSSVTDDEFVFFGENALSGVITIPLFGGEFRQRSVDNGAAFVQFNISSPMSGKRRDSNLSEFRPRLYVWTVKPYRSRNYRSLHSS